MVEPDTSSLSKEEMEIMTYLIEEICEHHTANSISEATHNIIWEAAIEGEEIPLEATLAAIPGEITNKHTTWADTLINKRAA